jgi:CRISPR-associated endonuclease/helicase Cas3
MTNKQHLISLVRALTSMCYAHTPPSLGGNWHDLGEHSISVAHRTARRLPSGLQDTGFAMGLCHDIEKRKDAFQEYLKRSAGGRKRCKSPGHKLEGAQLFFEWDTEVGDILAFLVDGHHGKIVDRLGEELPPLPSDLAELADAVRTFLAPYSNKDLTFVDYRLLYSALIDADHTDTAEHFTPQYAIQRAENPPVIPEHMCRLQARISSLQAQMVADAADSEVNHLRQTVRLHVLEQLRKHPEPSVFSLTAATGAGKTRTALEGAASLAVARGYAGVVYVAPFNSILDQTLGVFQELCGHENVLGDYTTIDPDDEIAYWADLRVTWNVPVVATSAVQFFQSLWSNKPSRSRKVHQYLNRVIILDEPQAYPSHLWNLIVTTLRQLVGEGRCSLILMTATPPPVRGTGAALGFAKSVELAPPLCGVQAPLLKRTVYKRLSSMETLLSPGEQALVVTNSRAAAYELFQRSSSPHKFYLTTLLTPEHRRRIISEVRQRLADGKPVVLYATSLIEAGVDLDFPVGFRSLAPLESIIQTGGRINRNGLLAQGGILWVYDDETDRNIQWVDRAWKTRCDRTRVLLFEQNANPADPSIWEAYVHDTYGERLDVDRGDVSRAAEECLFEEVGRVRLISDYGQGVFVPVGEGARIWEEIQGNPRGVVDLSASDRRLLQQYVVSIPKKVLEAGRGSFFQLVPGTDNLVVLCDTRLYDGKVGLALPVHEELSISK